MAADVSNLRLAYELLKMGKPADMLSDFNKRQWVRWRDEWLDEFEKKDPENKQKNPAPIGEGG